MKITASEFGKIGVSAAVGTALVVATALPASAASSSTTDPKNDTVKQTLTTSSIKVTPKKDSKVDITKLTAKRSGGTLRVTITLAKLKEGYISRVDVLLRSTKTKSADSTVLLNTGDNSHSLLNTGGATRAMPASITLKTKTGAKGTFVVTIPLDTIGTPAKVSVAASVFHLTSRTTTKSVSTQDTTGKVTKSSRKVAWTGFLT